MSTTVRYAETFPGSGEVARLLRAMPWEESPLGPPEEWPAELRTSVRLALGSRFPIVVWWGPSLIKFYNDAYSTILGEKHPWALGRPAREVWPEIWDVIGPMLEGVMSRQEATWSEDQFLALERKGFPEECYFTFSYSPIIVDSGTVEGVFTAVAETTERVLAHRRLDLLQRISARGAAADSEETAVAAAVDEIRQASADIPFAVFYRVRDDGVDVIDATHGAEELGPDASGPDPFEVASSFPSGRPRETRLREPRAFPPWSEPANRAAVVPVPSDGEERLALVAGLSPRLPWNDSYRGFAELLASQLGAVLSGARAVESARRRVEAMAELDRAKTAFFNNVSHEFRTPLTLLRAPLEEARERGTGLSPDDTELAHRNALRLLDLVNALLDFSRLEAGRADARFSPTDLAKVTADIASGFRSLLESAGLGFEVDVEALPAPVYLDLTLFESVLLNLLSNAFKFTPSGSISVSLSSYGDGAELQVSDTGVGIPEDRIPHLFERFQRAHAPGARSSEGAGIGLALVREIVDLHGATVSVESESGVGTTFRVRLPFGEEHLDPSRIEPEGGRRVPSRAPAVLAEAERWFMPERSEPPAPRHGPTQGTVLVVDDNTDMLVYLERLLMSDGWTVRAASNATEARCFLEDEEPDLLLTDVMLPGTDGFSLVRELRASGRMHMPVVILSARAGKEAITEGLQHGADDYLVKPFVPAELVSRVRTHVELARARRSMANSRRALREVEKERTRVARDLHDEVGQSLLALRLSLQKMAQGGAEVGSLIADVDRGVEQLRAVVQGLRPPALDELGVPAALTALAVRMGEASGIEIDADLEGLCLPDECASAVYHIVQEALSNAIRHAGADRIQVTAEGGEAGTTLVVLDDGQGRNGAEPAGSGQGLLNMRERAHLIGGVLAVTDTAGGGTRVELFLPRMGIDEVGDLR